MGKQAKTDDHIIELVINTTPTIISPIIKTAVQEFKPEEGLVYSIYEESRSASDAYRRLLVVAAGVAENSQITSVDCIGIMTLQSLGNEQTLFRVPPRNNWRFLDAPQILSDSDCKGLVNKHAFNIYWNESYFTHLLEKLDAEFKRLGFKETIPRRVWRWLTSHKIFSIITTIIMLVAAVITIILYSKGFFG